MKQKSTFILKTSTLTLPLCSPKIRGMWNAVINQCIPAATSLQFPLKGLCCSSNVTEFNWKTFFETFNRDFLAYVPEINFHILVVFCLWPLNICAVTLCMCTFMLNWRQRNVFRRLFPVKRLFHEREWKLIHKIKVLIEIWEIMYKNSWTPDQILLWEPLN